MGIKFVTNLVVMGNKTNQSFMMRAPAFFAPGLVSKIEE